MVINNVEIKKGDCVIGCAVCEGGYHYTLAFAFKVDNIVDDKVVCIFYIISFDDFIIRGYHEKREFKDFVEFTCGYDIYIVNEDALDNFVSQVQNAENLEEDDVWNYFEAAHKDAIAVVQEYQNK